jgi:RNA polymerase sigma-70 factor (ECF subfamily)
MKQPAVSKIVTVMAVSVLEQEASTIRDKLSLENIATSFTPEFDAVYREVHPELLRFILRRLIPPDFGRAEEIAHDAFTKLWQHRANLPLNLNETRAWLFTVARNFMLKSNAQGFRGRELFVAISDEAIGFVPDPVDFHGTHTFRIDLKTAWQQLTPAAQEVISLHYWESLSANEAGQVLGTTARAYRIRLHRARNQLKKLLEIKN